jgi:hypothetical protein
MGVGEPDGGVHRYISPAVLPLNHYALVGTWRLVGGERQVLAGAEGEIRFHALAGEVNLVLGLEPGTPPRLADVVLDGRPLATITIDRHDLFNLWSGPTPSTRWRCGFTAAAWLPTRLPSVSNQ